ncbi:MAG: AbrB/MazE/SpoVT family DNA-binding domain-containing protein [Actinomycetota bacterium]
MDIVFAKVFSGRRITLPKQVREDLGVKPGDKIEFSKKNVEWVIESRPVEKSRTNRPRV